MNGPTAWENPRTLRDDLEVVSLANRLLLCVGNETYELPTADAPFLARLIDLLSAGVGPAEAGEALDLPGSKVAEYLEELRSLGCFVGDPGLPRAVSVPPVPGNAGFVGRDATSLGIAQRLRADGYRVSFAEWSRRPGQPGSLRATQLPESDTDRGPPAQPEVDGYPESATTGIDPWSPGFEEWLKGKTVVVVSTGYLSPATHEVVNARCGELGIPWLGVRSSAAFTEIGPPVRPPLTPCYVCLALRVLINRSMWTEPPKLGMPDLSRAPVPAEDRALLTSVLATAELRTLVAGTGPKTSTEVVRIDWATNRVSRLPVLKLPNCPGCEWWNVDGT